MSKLDNFTDGLLELYNIERDILNEELAKLGVNITASDLRKRAKERLKAPKSGHNYDGGTDVPDNNKPPEVLQLDG